MKKEQRFERYFLFMLKTGSGVNTNLFCIMGILSMYILKTQIILCWVINQTNVFNLYV